MNSGKSILALSVVIGSFFALLFISLVPGAHCEPIKLPIKVGILLPLSGDFADWGESIQKGLKLALLDFPAIQPEIQDDACQSTQAVTGARLMLMQDIRIFFVGCVSSVNAIAPVVEKAGGVIFVLGGIDNATLRGFDNIIDLATEVSNETLYLASYIEQLPKLKRIGIIHGNNFFGEELGQELAKDLRDFGREVSSSEKIDLAANDCRAIALRTLDKKPDSVFVHASEATAGLCVKTLRQLGFNGEIFAPYTSESSSFLQAAGSAAEGVRYTSNSSTAEKSASILEWESKFAAKFKTSPIPHAYMAYDGVHWVHDALIQCTGADVRCLIDYFKHLGKIEGVSGSVEFKTNGGALRPFGIKRIHNGDFQWVVKEIKLGAK